MWLVLRGLAALLFLGIGTLRAEKLEIVWPTPDTRFAEGRAWTEFVQPTASGVAESGLYGGTRNGGLQFHEGLDLRPIKRDRKGEPLDEIFAVLPGVVRHIASIPGQSSYGRYIVIEHSEQTPTVCTLYAHLSAIARGLGVGDRVERGQVIATMGRSASGYAIPRERAHLHFEINMWVTENFQRWYNGKKFGSKNDHGIFNGMNLVGVDPLDFYTQLRDGRVDGFLAYYRQLKPAVVVRVVKGKMPGFIRRYPSLVSEGFPLDGNVGGWEITIDEYGVPFRWKGLTPMEVLTLKAGEIKVLSVDAPLVKKQRSKSLVISRRGAWEVGRDLDTLLDLLFEGL